MKVRECSVEHDGVTYEVTRSMARGIEVRRGDRLVVWMSHTQPDYTLAKQRERAERETLHAELMAAVLDAIGVEP